MANFGIYYVNKCFVFALLKVPSKKKIQFFFEY